MLLKDISPIVMAGFLYLGAFLGLSIYFLFARRISRTNEDRADRLTRKDMPWLIGATLAGGVVAPICQMIGLTLISGFSASLLLNLEGILTAVIATIVFKESAGKKLWLAVICMTIAGVLLSWDPGRSKFSVLGPLLIVLATFCWGVDNNLTRQISDKNPMQITWVKGLLAGSFSLLLALISGKPISLNINIIYVLLLGAFSYGLSIVFFIKALKSMGASHTGAFYSLGPFIGALVSLVIFREWLGWIVFPALIFMGLGVWLIVVDQHIHEHTHGAIIHSHSHRHDDFHHMHEHKETITGTHTHEHTHADLTHTHAHWPDNDHRHAH